MWRCGTYIYIYIFTLKCGTIKIWYRHYIYIYIYIYVCVCRYIKKKQRVKQWNMTDTCETTYFQHMIDKGVWTIPMNIRYHQTEKYGKVRGFAMGWKTYSADPQKLWHKVRRGMSLKVKATTVVQPAKISSWSTGFSPSRKWTASKHSATCHPWLSNLLGKWSGERMHQRAIN